MQKVIKRNIIWTVGLIYVLDVRPLNSISENVWDYLKRKIRQHHPKNNEEVWEYAQLEWKKIPVDFCKKL